jgi:DUF438 domain-containing protein
MSSEGNKNSNRLYQYLEGLYKGSRTREWYDLYKEDLESATAWSVNAAIDELINNFDDFDTIESSVARFIRASAESLDRIKETQYPVNHFLKVLADENDALKKIRIDLSSYFKEFSHNDSKKGIIESLTVLLEIRSHYLKIQYALFPALEECTKQFHCVKLMWQIQDEILNALKVLIQFLDGTKQWDQKAFNRLFGVMYMKMGALLYREEKILYPIAFKEISTELFTKMNRDIVEYGTAFGVLYIKDQGDFMSENIRNNEIDLSIGKLLPEQINLMLMNLPLDITYVDENDRVKYYSQGKERIFPRSPGIIGRDVQNCHPPKSVHVVQKIVGDFKSGKRTEAEFWIPMGDKFVHIRYFPLFKEGIYRGVIEVSQDIAPIRALEGEKRLLDETSI